MKISEVLLLGLAEHYKVRSGMSFTVTQRPAMCNMMDGLAGVKPEFKYLTYMHMREHRRGPINKETPKHLYIYAWNFLREHLVRREGEAVMTYELLLSLWRQYYFFMIFDLARKGE